MKNIGRILMWIGIVVLLIIIIRLVGQVQTLSSSIGGTSAIIPLPTPTIYPSAATVVERVQMLSRLETASYHVEKVITAESGQGPMGFLFGDKLLLIAYGQVIAGIDLSDIEVEDIVLGDAGTIYMRVPEAKIFVTTLDNNRTSVYDRRTGMAGLNPQLETAARQEAERLILQTAMEDGILEKADENARQVLRSLFQGLGFLNIIFVDVLPTPTPTPFVSPTPFAVSTPSS
ncbi:MAG: DUF4230 domain-containing protein [Anaerolineae bacterium]|nr:DUF4230 domain-containing protein [Anaerolineae bacterium]